MATDITLQVFQYFTFSTKYYKSSYALLIIVMICSSGLLIFFGKHAYWVSWFFCLSVNERLMHICFLRISPFLYFSFCIMVSEEVSFDILTNGERGTNAEWPSDAATGSLSSRVIALCVRGQVCPFGQHAIYPSSNCQGRYPGEQHPTVPSWRANATDPVGQHPAAMYDWG